VQFTFCLLFVNTCNDFLFDNYANMGIISTYSAICGEAQYLREIMQG